MSFDKVAYEESAYLHGYWDAIVNDSSVIEDELMKIKDVRNRGHMYIGGEVVKNQSFVGYIGYYDDIGYDLAHLHFIEGRKAENEGEIVVEKHIADTFQLSLQQNVQLEYKVNEQMKNQQFQVVGIIEDYVCNWDSRGLNIITYKMESYTYDSLLESHYTVNLWNDLRKLEYDYDHKELPISIFYNEANFPEIKNANILYKNNYILGFSNETALLLKMIEIVCVSFIAVISTMTSSLNKRESHFILYRSIGMTYKQLQKLIIYEGYLLSLLALICALISSFLLVGIIMFIYSLLASTFFVVSFTFSVLFIELGICIMALAVGIILPTLTIYDLPLTRKDGGHIYHPKKRKIRKSTFIYYVRKEFSQHLFINTFISVFLLIILLRGMIVVEATQNYIQSYQDISDMNLQADFIWYALDTLDISPLLNQKDIHVYADRLAWGYPLKWQDMDQEDNIIATLRKEVLGNIICIENDQQLKEYLRTFGITDIENQEAVVIIPNHNYATDQDHFNHYVFNSYDSYDEHYQVDITRQENGVYPKDIGLMKKKKIQVEVDHDIDQILTIQKVIHLNEELQREYFKDYTVIVNQDTFYQMFSRKADNYINVDVDNESARNQVQSYFIQQISQNQGTIDRRFINEKTYKMQQLHLLKCEFMSQMIYTVIMIIDFLFLINLMRLLLTYKFKKELGLLNAIGMTKKRIYGIYMLHASIIYLVMLAVMVIGWLMYKQSDVNVNQWLILIIIYILYMQVMMIPIRGILKKRTLDFMR